MRRTGLHLVLLAAAALSGRAGAAPSTTVLIDADFSRLAAGRMRTLDANERITGALPGAWQDNSSWAPVWVCYRRLEDEGRGFLRMEITKMAEGRAQLTHPIPDFEDNTLFRLRLALKSETQSAVEVGIRQRGTPYEFRWSRTLSPGANWREYEFTFTLKRNTQPVGLWINLGAVGSVDIARAHLVRLTREAFAAELRAKYPAGGPANLLRNSRLPLGLQSGWSMDRDHCDADDVVIAPDPSAIGPSGAPALRIKANKPLRLTGEPFGVPLVFDRHVASLYARGTGTLSLSVHGGRRTGGKGKVTLDADKWQRLTVQFAPQMLRKLYALRLGGEGEIWIDALLVERGEQAGEYRSQRACEVALAVGSPARVQFDDEPAAVRYAVTGEASGAVLKAKVVTPYGQKVLPDVRLPGGFLRKGEIRYDAFPDRPYGPFRIEARVVGADGKPLSPPNELVVYRLRRPRYWMKDAPNSLFGTHTNATRRHILMAKAVGVNWARLHDAGTPYIGWFHLEPEKGQWRFADAELKRYRRYGMKILGAFSTAPKWASHFRHEKPHNSYFDRFYQPLRMEDFARYVRTVTERYKDGVIDAWDVWNEPWIHAWWGVDYDETQRDRDGYLTSKDAPADFARLMGVAYKTAKAVDPDCTVCGVNSTTGGGGSRSYGGDEWTAGVVAAGGLAHCDAVVYHHYTGELFGWPGDGAERGFAKGIGPAVAKAGGRLSKPVWMTEGSPDPRGLGEGFYHHTLPYASEDDAFASADRLARYVVGLLAQGVRKVFLYSMHTHGYFGHQSWRCLVTPEGYLHPSAAGLAAAAWLLEDSRFVKQVPAAEGVTAYLFQAPGRAVAVLSPQSPHPPYALPSARGVDVLDTFGNPVPAGEKLGRRLVYLHAKGSAAGLEEVLKKRAAPLDGTTAER